MGGFGSGRSTYATSPTVGQCHHLDVNEVKDALEYPGTTATYTWRDDYGDGEKVAEIAVSVTGPADADRATGVRLRYTATKHGDAPRRYDYRVPVTYTPCNFGGERPWFQCPRCGDRVGKLYRPPARARFRCRECYDLGYQSSRTSGDTLKQAELRYRRAFAKADAKGRRPHPNGEPWFPERPKGMHTETFDRLLADVRNARQEWDGAIHARMRTMVERHRGLLADLDDVEAPPAP
jgi:hypothetical protein